MKINFKQLEAFVAVAELSSFRRAAEKLDTTQPNISSRISGLEERLGIKLLERDSASVHLTPTGDALLPRARHVLQSMDAFIAAAGKEHLFEGRLRLGVTEMVVHSWLSEFLSSFKHRFANIDVELTVDLSSNLSTALNNRSIDLALQSGPFAFETSGFIELGEFPLIWVCAPQLHIDDSPLSLASLVKHSVLTHARGTLPFEQLQKHLAQSKEQVRLVPSTHLAACLQLTREGIGIACLPDVMVRSELNAGTLVRLNYSWTPDPLVFSARFDAESAAIYVREAADLARATAVAFEKH